MATIDRVKQIFTHEESKNCKLFKALKIDHKTIKSESFDSLNSVQFFGVNEFFA